MKKLLLATLAALALMSCAKNTPFELRMMFDPLGGNAYVFKCSNSTERVGDICCKAERIQEDGKSCVTTMCKPEDGQFYFTGIECD
jgi:hypothetical protein